MSNAETFEYKGKIYDVSWKSNDTRHGGPFDRGSADSYYGRGCRPHYYVAGTGTSSRIEKEEMTEQEINDYYAGYYYNEDVCQDYKEW